MDVLAILKGARDAITGSITTVDYAHHEVHDGTMYQSSYKSPDASDIADDGSIDVLIDTGVGFVDHLTFVAAAGGDAELEVFADKYYSSNNSDLVREAVRRELEWRKSEEQAKIAASLASLYVEDETARAFTNLGLEDI